MEHLLILMKSLWPLTNLAALVTLVSFDRTALSKESCTSFVSFLSSEITVLLLTSSHFFKLTDNPKRTPLREISDLPLKAAMIAILPAFFVN